MPALESTLKRIASLPEDQRAEPERQVRAMDRRLQSFIARHALLVRSGLGRRELFPERRQQLGSIMGFERQFTVPGPTAEERWEPE